MDIEEAKKIVKTLDTNNVIGVEERVAITGFLYRNDKKIICGLWESLESFVEKLKELNPKWIDRRDFKIRDFDGYIIKEWRKK